MAYRFYSSYCRSIIFEKHYFGCTLHLTRSEEENQWCQKFVPLDCDWPIMAKSLLSGETHYGSNPTEEQFHPDLLMDSGNVVLVTITYRVGPLGYLCLGTESAPGNLSLWDQVIEI